MNKYYEKDKELYKSRAVANNKRYIARNKAFICAARDVPCADCGERHPYYVMDFHHVRGKKVMNVSRMAIRPTSLKKLKTEIEKCEVICSNCHRYRTFAE